MLETAESLAGRISLFLVVRGDLDPVLAAYPLLRDDGDDLICACLIGGESANARASHHGVGGDGKGYGHDDSGEGADLGCAPRKIVVYQRTEWTTAFLEIVEERKKRKRAGARFETICAPYLIGPSISICYVLELWVILHASKNVSVMVNTSKRRGIQVVQIESTQI